MVYTFTQWATLSQLFLVDLLTFTFFFSLSLSKKHRLRFEALQNSGKIPDMVKSKQLHEFFLVMAWISVAGCALVFVRFIIS